MASGLKAFNSTREMVKENVQVLPDGRTVTTKTTQKFSGDGKLLEELVETRTVYQDKAVSPQTQRCQEPSKGVKNISANYEKDAKNSQLNSFNASKTSPDSNNTSCIKGDSLTDYRQQLLRLHNEKRTLHNASALVETEKLNGYAQEWADYLAKTGNFQHRTNSTYGENIFMGYNSQYSIPPSEVAERWYSEVQRYDYERASTGSGHFTQMVWKSSKEVGFGIAVAKDGKIYVVANYYPAGNMLGTYKENVSPPKK